MNRLLPALAAAALLPVSAQTVLIDFDDGNAGNGIHDASIGNGGFEDPLTGAADGTPATVPHWDSFFAEGDSGVIVTSPAHTGSSAGRTSGWSGSGSRVQLSQIVSAADWTIGAGDVFTFTAVIQEGVNADDGDNFEVRINAVDGSGSVLGAIVIENGIPLPDNGSWTGHTVTTGPIAAGSAFIGARVQLRLLMSGARSEFANVDNVSLTVTTAEPPPPPAPPRPTPPTPDLPFLPAAPNIVIIYGDDIGYGDVSAHGTSAVATPRIDSIASAGIRFTNGHAPASTCTPSRYSLLTGEYAWRTPGTGIASGVSALKIRPGSVTLPSMLRQAGYATAVVGKWHLGLGTEPTDYNAAAIVPGPREIGFDYFYGIPATNDRVPCVMVENQAVVDLDPLDPLLVNYGSKVGDEPTGAEAVAAGPEPGNLLSYYVSSGNQHAGTIINGISRIGFMDGGVAARWRDEDHADQFVEKSGNFIEANVAAGKPFFLFLSSADVHVPRAPNERFQGVSGNGWRGDALLQLDWTTGAILDRLTDPDDDGDSSDSVLDNTLVIFTSDNGPASQDGYVDGGDVNPAHDNNGIYRGGKYSILEGGTRVPFFAQWPGTIPAGTVSGAIVSQTDFMATFAALTGQVLPADAGPDSENVLAALLGTSALGREVLLTQKNNTNPKAVRRDNWKYHSNNGNLYNLAVDPGEATNVAGTNLDIVADLQYVLADSEATAMVTPMLAWWPFDDGSGGAAREISGADHTATLHGTPSWSAEFGVPHLTFDGSNDRAEVGGLPALTGSFTVTTWARSSTATWASSGALVARRPQFALVPVGGTREIRFVVYADATTPETLTFDLATLAGFDLTAWHHYAARYDAPSGTAALYVDGVRQATADFAADGPHVSTVALTLGADGTSAWFSGDLSDARLYPALLPHQRIANTASGRLDDSDVDGMLSDWEHRHGLDPFDPSDLSGNPDADSFINLEEFQNNTSPLVADVAGGGLRAHWPLDETAGTTAPDVSGNNHHGTLVNGPAWMSGPGRQFLSFNGTNQYVNVTGLPDLKAGVTAACWARSANATWNADGVILSRRPQFILRPVAGTTRVSFVVFHDGGTQTGAEIDLATIPGFNFDLTEWHHYAGTYAAATGKIYLYVDGILRATASVTPGDLDAVTGPLHLGRDVGLANYLDGDIDEVMVFDRALDASEVTALAGGFDDDQDGLDDSFEWWMIGADPGDALVTLDDVLPGADPDGDGRTNLEESIAGTDPLSGDDFFRIENTLVGENGGFRNVSVEIAGRAGRIYTLFASADLSGPWVPVDTLGPLADDEAIMLHHLGAPWDRGFLHAEVSGF